MSRGDRGLTQRARRIARRVSQPTPVGESPSATEPAAPSRVARNTAIFSVLTGLSRIAGLVREIVAASYFGTKGPMSAFTIAFQVPNLLRSLVADAALSAAFVPVFTELLEKGRRKDAMALAGALFGLILTVLGILSAVFFFLSPYLMPLFTGGQFTPELDALTSGLARVLFGIVVLLGLNGLVVGILNAYDHFTIPALAPVVWNLVIIVGLVVLKPLFSGDEEIYAYAIGVLLGTAVQFAMALPVLKRVGFELKISFHWRDPRIKRILILMLPVTIGLGLINFNLLINSSLGSLISDEAPAAIDRAFRLYMLPQGVFSVAIATVLFPALSRLATRRDMDGLRAMTGEGTRLIALMLLPAAAATLVLAEPLTRLVYERGEFDAQSTAQASEALFWFAFSLPFSGVNLLLTRTFFSLQRPWTPTRLAGVTLAINTAVSLALYKPLGIGGIVIGTVVATAAMTVGQAWRLRAMLGGMELARTLRASALMLGASVALGAVAWGVHALLDDALGRSLAGQAVAVGAALTAGSLVYLGLILLAGVPEAHGLVRRLRRAA
jgi:putative peptidoglycan lipid II flippase